MKPILENSYSSFYPDLKEDPDRLQFAMMAAGVGIWELDPISNQVLWDDRCRELFGLAKENKIEFDKAIKFIHHDDLGGVLAAVSSALKGENGGRYDMRYRTIGADDGKLRWVHFSGQAYFDHDGNPTKFGGIAQDITDYTETLLRSERALQESEERFRTVVSSAPAGIALFVGRDLIIEMPNKAIIDIIGKGPDIAGKSLRDVMPELSNQPFLGILDNIFTTGKPFSTYGIPANIVHNGVMTTSYYNLMFSPLFDNNGNVYAVLDISIDVTEAVLSRKKIEETQYALQDAIELAQLATWTIDAVNGKVEYSERMKSWLGIDENTRELNSGINALPDHERERVKKAMEWAMNPKSKGLFDLEYGIINQSTGREKVIHSQARTLFNEEGKPLKVMGVAQDVTQQRNIRLALEHQVQQRTEELDAANEELQATNEELLATNEDLAELNDALEQSNENLQRFAHVASHDLKEPIRKIKTFLSMIEADKSTVLSDKTKLLMQRVYTSTERMYSMINGVLSYSTINATGHSTEKVDLQKVVAQIEVDLELLIEEKKATIHFNDLPVIDAAEILMYQLFSNLIINSLKFSREDVLPVINILAAIVEHNDKSFAKIVVEDNGLGFSPEKSEHIFNMFTRLHSKDKFEGTGLGLSLCKKIVQRHSGIIEATGKPGAGARFTILLPLRQETHNI